MADALTRFVSLVLIEKNCFYESKKRKVIFNIRLGTNDESDAAFRLLILIFFHFLPPKDNFFRDNALFVVVQIQMIFLGEGVRL